MACCCLKYGSEKSTDFKRSSVEAIPAMTMSKSPLARLMHRLSNDMSTTLSSTPRSSAMYCAIATSKPTMVSLPSTSVWNSFGGWSAEVPITSTPASLICSILDLAVSSDDASPSELPCALSSLLLPQAARDRIIISAKSSAANFLNAFIFVPSHVSYSHRGLSQRFTLVPMPISVAFR